MQLSSAAQVNIACSAKMERQQIVSVAESAARRLGYEQLRDLQLKVVAEVVTGRDVFAILPTGYGKSLYYAILPWMFDHLLQPDLPSIVVVLTPLTAIIKDQDCLG